MNRSVEQWQLKKNAISSEGGIVACQNWLAAAVGSDVLALGGNAVDAAVASAFSLNALEPWMSGLGGSGYIVIWLAKDNRAFAIDFQGVLPKAIDRENYPLDPSIPNSIMGYHGVRNSANTLGFHSITVPGAVAGLSKAQKEFGNLNFDRVLNSAILLAERGLPINWFTNLQIALEARDLSNFADTSAIYLPGGFPPQPEQCIDLGRLAKTLRKLSDNGPDEFYTGSVAELMVKDLQKGGSKITLEDFENYEAQFVEPLCYEYRGSNLYTPGGTSGGVRLNESLKHIERHLDLNVPFGAHTYETYAAALDTAFVSHKKRYGKVEKHGCTSHISSVDSEGNMVALTCTLLGRFGSKVVLPQTGILMNNAVSYFDPRAGFPTSMDGGKRINSSNMCPVICVNNGEAKFSVGASGANQIIPCITQIVSFLLDYKFSLEQAFNMPRIDANGDDMICVDSDLDDLTVSHLRKKFPVRLFQNQVFPKLFGCPSGVLRHVKDGITYGCSDKANPVAGAAAESRFNVTRPLYSEQKTPWA